LKNRPLYALLQPEEQNSYWADLIRAGIGDGARNFGYEPLLFDDADAHKWPQNSLVLVVGHHGDWLEASLSRLCRMGARPLIVNACMLPLHRLRYSGITFELEAMMEHLLALLAAAGRTKTALLGTSPASLSDRVKTDAFLRAKELTAEDGAVICAEGRLEDCVDSFADSLAVRGWDAVICANDTVAVCLMQKLQDMGLSLPQDLYIIGMGNFYMERMLPLSLTSVMFDYRKMGEAAVELYHNLEKSRTPCRMRVSLPCRLEVRASAPLNIPLPGEAAPPPTVAVRGDYFGGERAQSIIRIEAILQSCDTADREILYGIAAGETCETVAARLFFSGRAVRYRLKKLLARYGFRDRAELEQALAAVIPKGDPKNHGKT